MVSVRVRPVGERAFLLETAALDDVLALHAGLEASRPDGVIDLVPAARTVLVRVDPRAIPLSAARAWAERTAAAAEHRTAGDGPTVEIDVAYDGDDLTGTAALLGLTADELVRRHTDAAWTVAFTGSAPGFGYLVSDDWPYDVPRLDTPRTRVPAGAVNDVAKAFAFAEAEGLTAVDETGGVLTVAPPYGLSATPAVVRRPPPALGEHDAEIREWLRRPSPGGSSSGA